MFEGLMASLIVPEARWGTRSFGANNVRYATAQMLYCTQGLGYPVWGLPPSSTPDNTGNYQAYGALPLASGSQCCAYATDAITPYAAFLALTVLPGASFNNIAALKRLYPAIYGPYGFYDAVNPTTGSLANRYLTLDQAMILASLDNALNPHGLSQWFAQDAVGQTIKPYLSTETFSVFG